MDTKGEKSGETNNPQREVKHPPEWQASLNHEHMAGQNEGAPYDDTEMHIPTAYDVKEVHARLRDFNDADLKQIPIIPAGARLRQGAAYADLAEEHPHEITASGGMSSTRKNYYVPKSRVPYEIWNRLMGEPPRG